MPFTVGETVGPYRIIEQLGQGGMATVYKAYHASLDRYVAIKVLHPAFLEDKNFHARFQREARLVAKMEHPNIVPVYDYAGEGTYPYLVMKYIEGETLKARLERGPLPDEETLRIVEVVGGALAYAHGMGILHRDIKPSNVILAQDGRIYLADFGLARIAQSGTSTLTSDMIMGTPQYISPEQATGRKDLDAGTDIYSFGVMLYEMTVGRVPYNADTPYAVIHDHIYAPLPLPREVNPRLHPDVERVLLKSLAKDRADRYEDVSAQVAAFREAWLEQMSARATSERSDVAADAGATLMAVTPPAEATALASSAFAPEAQSAEPAETKIAAPQPPADEATLLGASAGAAAAQVPAAPLGSVQKPGRSWKWAMAAGGLVLVLVVASGALLAARAGGLFGAAGRRPTLSPQVVSTPSPAVEATSTGLSTAPQATPAVGLTGLDALRAAVTKHPDDPQAHMALADAYFAAGLNRLGLDERAAAAEAGKGDVAFLRDSGDFFIEHKAWLAAAIFYTTLAELYGPVLPSDIRENLNQVIYMASGLSDPLFPIYLPFDRLLALNEPLGEIAQAHYAITRSLLPGNLPVFDKLIAEHPRLSDVRLLQAEVALRRGQTDDARTYLAALLADDSIPQWVRDYAESMRLTLP